MMNQNAQQFCGDHLTGGCRLTCPLAEACRYKKGDTRQIWAERVNAKADELAKEEE